MNSAFYSRTVSAPRLFASLPAMALLAAIGLSVLLGCTGEPAPTTDPNGSPTGGGAGVELLQQTIARYQQAPGYRDRVKLHLRYEVVGQPLDDRTELSFTLLRPNLFRFEVVREPLHFTATCDGEHLRAIAVHPDNDNFDRQIVDRPAPEGLSVASVYSTTEYVDVARPHQMASLLERTHATLDELPLALAIHPKPLAHLLADPTRINLRPDQPLDGRECHRVAIATEGGDLVYWIERDTLLIRRIEFPTAEIAKELVPQAEYQQSVRDVTLVAEIENPTFEFEENRADWQAPGEGEQKVRYFVYPPAPLPSRLFGRRPTGWSLQDLTGRELSNEAFAGRIAALLWWNDTPPSKTAMQQFNEVYERLAGEPVQFVAVCAEPGTLNSGHVGAIANQWLGDEGRKKVTLPIFRDLKGAGRDVFRIGEAPTLVVIDAQGIVQVVEVGANPRLAEELSQVLKRLLAGDNVAAELLTRQANEQVEYQRQLAIARGEANQSVAPVEGELPAASDPRQMQLVRRWKEGLPAPGNGVAVTDRNGTTTAWILSAGRTLVEFGEGGPTGRRIEPPIAEGAEMTFLRTAVDAAGRRLFVAGARLGPQVVVFDDAGRLVTAYPAADQRHEGIQDAALFDVDRNGELELYVGFWGAVGTHGVGLDGARRWSNRLATPVLSLCPLVSPEGARMLVTSDRGLLLPLNAQGEDEQAFQVGDKSIHLLAAAQFPAPRKSAYLGCSFLPDGGLLAVALDDRLQEAWAYPLPPGPYRKPVEFLASGKLFGEGGQWVIAGAEGSVHVLSDDGEFVDHFRTGEIVTGIVPCGQTLLICTQDGVEGIGLIRPTR